MPDEHGRVITTHLVDSVNLFLFLEVFTGGGGGGGCFCCCCRRRRQRCCLISYMSSIFNVPDLIILTVYLYV